MATVQRFEDLLAWQKARELTKEIYKTFRSCRDGGFTDQIQRAAVSIVSNIAEGFESGTRDGFINYLYIAKGSSGEVRAQLYVAQDIGYVDVETFKRLKFKVEECSKLIFAFIRGLKSSPHGGLQRKREMTKDEQDREEFMSETRRELSKTLPHLYNPDGTKK